MLCISSWTGDDAMVQMLLECALTVTVTSYGSSDLAFLAGESIRLSEVLRCSSQVAMDNFIVFADKVDKIAKGKQAIFLQS